MSPSLPLSEAIGHSSICSYMSKMPTLIYGERCCKEYNSYLKDLMKGSML